MIGASEATTTTTRSASAAAAHRDESPSAAAFYDPDDVAPPRTPPLTRALPVLAPYESPSPPYHCTKLRYTPEKTPPPDAGYKKHRGRPHNLDAFLLATSCGGRYIDMVRQARKESLQSDDEGEPARDELDDDEEEEGEEEERAYGRVDMPEESASAPEQTGRRHISATEKCWDATMTDHSEQQEPVGAVDLTALAADALRAHAQNASQTQAVSLPASPSAHSLPEPLVGDAIKPETLRDAADLPPDGTSVTTYPDDTPMQTSPELARSTPLTHSPSIAPSKASHASPAVSTPITLPSISAQFKNYGVDPSLMAEQAIFPQSPPSASSRSRYSPPRSPTTTFHLPSPSQHLTQYYLDSTLPRSGHANANYTYSTIADFARHMVENASVEQVMGVPNMTLDRMSIEGVMDPRVGGYKCTFPGCPSQPFQTQYLLNSHANVHSSVRPHYCPVKGCPRSEGGRGFKRKNEMIRHGLVHDSPGYVCPFCIGPEHKYPRPDNLQRHVRVHHMDKNMDDPQLREVLAQRREGPSKARRRRVGPT